MDRTRLKYYATDDCLKKFAEKYVDKDVTMDLEAICKRNSERTFIMIEEAPLQQNPMTTFRIEKHYGEFFGIKYISPFKVLLNQAKNYLQVSTNVLPALFKKNVDRTLYERPPFKLLNDAWSAQYIGNKISCLTLLMMALECFVNENIPTEINKGVDAKGQVINKAYIERRWDLKLKMQEIRDWYKITNERYAILISEIIPLQKLRNEFVHIKSDKPNSLDDPCVGCYDKLLNIDLNLAFDKVKEYVKLIDPNIVID